MKLRRRIYFSIWLSIMTLIVVMLASIYLVYGRTLESSMRTETLAKAEIITVSIDSCDDPILYLESIGYESSFRISYIAPDGTVLFDSYADEEQMENHADREEVIEAQADGYGFGIRDSATIGHRTYYSAILDNEGNTVRISQTAATASAIIFDLLPLILLLILIVLVACLIISKITTNKIIEPLNKVDFSRNESAYYDELSGFMQKIREQRTEIEKKSRDLENSKSTADTIVKSMSEGVLLLDSSGHVILSNDSAMELFDFKDDYHNKNIFEISRNPKVISAYNAIKGGDSTHELLEINGRIYNVITSPVENDGGGIILFIDITDRAKAEKLRREFSANVSHELKTPLTSIKGIAEMLLGGMVKEADRLHFLQNIKDETDRLIELIADIIKLSSLDELNTDIPTEEFNVSILVKDAADKLAIKAKERNVTVEVDAEDLFMLGNPQLIYELVYNLTDNAIKYNKEGGSVTIKTFSKDDRIHLKFKDTGIGISKEQIDRVFERFYRVDESRNKKTGGTGLGLSIVKHIVERHGGYINTESTEGEGTTIEIVL